VVALVLLGERDCAVCNRQDEWGCHARRNDDGSWERKAALPLRIDHEEVFRCPRRPIKDDPGYWRRLLFFYGMFKKGHLPDPGAVSEQSNKAMQLFALLDDAVADCNREKASRGPPPAGPSAGAPQARPELAGRPASLDAGAPR
jgi:hypothetical protein